MGSGPREQSTKATAATAFIDSEEFAVATISSLTLVGFGVPMVLICAQYFDRGFTDTGFQLGALAVFVIGLSGWKLVSSLRRAWTLHSTTRTGTSKA